MLISNNHIYIWGYSDQIPSSLKGEKILLWKNFSENENIVSIPELTERWAVVLKKEYLQWVHDLGNIKINKQTITQFLKIRKEFSVWWLSLIVEKSNFSKSPYINEIIKLLALNKWLNDKNIQRITLYSSDIKLNKSLQSYCFSKGIKLESKKNIFFKKKFNNFNFRYIFKNLPYEIKSFIWFFYKVFTNLPLKITGLQDFNLKDNKHIFVSYLFNMKQSDLSQFKFSSYWGNLPGKLIEKKIKSLWIHIYVKDNYLNNSFKAANLIRRLNLKNKFQKHVTLYSYMDFKVIYKVIKDWLNIYFKVKKINIKNNFPYLKGYDVWNYYKEDWFDSLVGINAVDNLLILNLFEKAFFGFKENKSFYYLLENQGWEIAMLSIISNLKKTKVVGFCHASVRFWDLRNFYDKREYYRIDKYKIPRPNILAVNSKYAFDLLCESGYPKNKLKLVEALRHLYLKKIIDNKSKLMVDKQKEKIYFLVLGDYLLENTKFQLGILNNLPFEIIKNLEIIMKPHPACNVEKRWFPNLNMNIKNDPISSLLAEADIAYCSELTSASMDAYSYGTKVLIASNPRNLNLSPLRGFKEVDFVRNSSDLEDIIVKFSLEETNNASQRCIFEISSDLHNWEELL